MRRHLLAHLTRGESCRRGAEEFGESNGDCCNTARRPRMRRPVVLRTWRQSSSTVAICAPTRSTNSPWVPTPASAGTLIFNSTRAGIRLRKKCRGRVAVNARSARKALQLLTPGHCVTSSTRKSFTGLVSVYTTARSISSGPTSSTADGPPLAQKFSQRPR